jgi:hypothetical protein
MILIDRLIAQRDEYEDACDLFIAAAWSTIAYI